MLSKVVFPAPLAPIIAVIRPALNIPLTLRRICFYLYFLLKGDVALTVSSVTDTEKLMFSKTMSIPLQIDEFGSDVAVSRYGKIH